MLNRRIFIASAMAPVLTAKIKAAHAADSLLESSLARKVYFAPAEESPHACTWMCWPSRPSLYGGAGRYFENIQQTLGRFAATIAENEPVSMLAAVEHHALASELCGPRVQLVDIPTDDMWARDSGPVFVKSSDGRLGAVDLNFNAWGNKQQHRLDRRVASAIAAKRGCRYFRAGIVGEGGGLEYDGDGTLILTDSCWVNSNRNPGLKREDIETQLRLLLGVEKVIWLPGVRGQDITDGHVDGSVRIVRPGVLMTGGDVEDTSEWGLALRESRRILAKTTDARGRRFALVDIPSAVDVRSSHSDFFSGYANYYVGNGAVYTPQFGDRRADDFAKTTLAQLYPGRRIEMLEVDRIYENGGGLHCVTQQEPAL